LVGKHGADAVKRSYASPRPITGAICFACDELKVGTFTLWPHCGTEPATDQDLVYSLALTDHYLTLTQAARVLLWSSWAAIVIGLLLLALSQSVGLLLLLLGASYWASYYLGRGSDEVTA
jgi:hypothetical protein